MLTPKIRLYPIPASSWALQIEDVASMDSRSSLWAHHGACGRCNHGPVSIEMGKTEAVHGLGLHARQRWLAVAWMD